MSDLENPGEVIEAVLEKADGFSLSHAFGWSRNPTNSILAWNLHQTLGSLRERGAPLEEMLDAIDTWLLTTTPASVGVNAAGKATNTAASVAMARRRRNTAKVKAAQLRHAATTTATTVPSP